MQNYGLAHVWAQGDFVTRGHRARAGDHVGAVVDRDRREGLERAAPEAPHEERGTGVLAFGRFRRRHQEARQPVRRTPQDNPFLALALSGQDAADHHHQTQPHLHDRMDVSDWITRCLKDTMDEGVGAHAERASPCSRRSAARRRSSACSARCGASITRC